jgi:hypothetical protein
MAGPEVTAALKLRDDMSPALARAGHNVGGFESVVKGATATMLGFLGADVVRNIGSFVGGSLDAIAASDKLSKQTEAAIRSTGGAAHVTAADVDRLAQSLEGLTSVDDKAIRNGENLLLTFTNIQNKAGKGNDVFDQATKIMTDMSVALGSDAASSAIQLGKALNDPIEGVTALRRVGVSFSETQLDQIKKLQQSGDLMGAQKVILAELTKEFGGSGAAMGSSAAGMKARIADMVEDVQRSLGQLLLPLLGKLVPYLKGAADAATDWFKNNGPLVDQIAGFVGGALSQMFDLLKQAFDWMKANQDVMKAAAIGFAAVGVAIGVSLVPSLLATAAAGFAAMIPLLPLYALILGIGAVVGLLAYAWINNFGDIQGKTETVWAVVQPVLQGAWSWISEYLPPALSTLGKIFGAVFGFVGAYVYSQAIFIASSIRTIVATFENVIGFVQAMPGRIQGAIGSLGSLLYRAGIDLVVGLWNGITAQWGRLIGNLWNLVRQLPDPLKEFLGIHSPSTLMMEVGRNYVAGLEHGITSSWPGLTRRVGDLGAPALAGIGSGAAGGSTSGVRDVHVHIADGAFIDGHGIDLLTRKIVERVQSSTGT